MRATRTIAYLGICVHLENLQKSACGLAVMHDMSMPLGLKNLCDTAFVQGYACIVMPARGVVTSERDIHSLDK